jgi:hypothetical protein
VYCALPATSHSALSVRSAWSIPAKTRPTSPSSDGVDSSYQFPVADAANTLIAKYGKTQSTSPGGGDTEARRQWAITDTVE